MTQRVKRTRWRLIALSAFAVLVVAHSVGWLWAAGRMQLHVDQWVADQRDAGLDVAHGDIVMRGYPFFLRARAPDVSIGEQGVWGWRATALDIDLTPTNLSQIIFRPRGVQMLEAEGAGVWRWQSDRMRISLSGDQHQQWALHCVALETLVTAHEEKHSIRVKSLDLSVGANRNDPTISDLILTVRSVSAQTDRGVIEAPVIDADISVRLVEGQEGLSVKKLVAEIEGANAELSGDLIIDAIGYPAGVIDADIKKPAGLARMLGKMGVLTVEDASMAEAGLAMASLAQGGRLKGPIILSDGEVVMAGVKLGEFAPVLPR